MRKYRRRANRRHGPTIAERLDRIGWLLGGIFGGLLVTMPIWMLMLGLI